MTAGTKVYDRKLRQQGVILNSDYRISTKSWVLVETATGALMWSIPEDLEVSSGTK